MTETSSPVQTSKWLEAAPPIPTGPYSPEKALDDFRGLHYALNLFLASQMVESEDYCDKSDPKKERLYFSTGYGLIQCVKGLMSFADEDVLSALTKVRHGNTIASQHRKRAASIGTRLAGFVVGSTQSSGTGFIKSMNAVERHAELVYAESLFEKALLGIVYSGDWLAFIKEALNMRTTINIYRQLGSFLEELDAAAQRRGEGPVDKSMDVHFRSGVCLGLGMSNIILSLMPSKVITVMELFGYKGDRYAGLAYLMQPGGWSSDSPTPTVGMEDEGLRRPICDMSLLTFHLFLSNFTFDGVDIKMAQKILDYHIERYPNGVFFLIALGRLSLCRSQPDRAIDYYTRALEAQSQYRNINHISHWEMAIAHMSLWNIPESLQHWRVLAAEASWSKATYTYGMAVCLLQINNENNITEAARLMDEIPKLRQRIAGKSIPLEKYVSRKARKFQQQGNHLLLPALEFCYNFLAISRSPRSVIVVNMLPQVQAALQNLEAFYHKSSEYQGGQGYWDDLCLAHFLNGVCLRYIAYPDPDAVADVKECSITSSEAEKDAAASFKFVLANSSKVVLDHHLIYYTYYEYARLLACQNDKQKAQNYLGLVLSGKSLGEAGNRKSKYSLESTLHIRASAALDALKKGQSL